ncbi:MULTISPECIES: hypothetical protein [Pseudomonadota]|uniref:hypothetical protein n=1 Tax=Pseudomonadota TaxID=1224 RepID=UPI000419D045|nr:MULTISPECIES: hypothetical protein [Pseudomonadota]MAB34448.1 hypothetical protein [Thalassospira sp.]|tara:strand:+ start:2930 stop:3616 length:687 start_codon:yes stop_codon:yes gene_type:complete
MSKLPVLFVSCDADNIQSQEQAGSGPARMIWGKQYKSVVVISSSAGQNAPEILQLKGNGSTGGRIKALLSDQGFEPEVHSRDVSSRHQLFRVLLAEEPGELTELILNTSMSELEYRRVGRCLEVLREQDVLVICLDDKPCHREADGVSLHDRHLRELLSAWAQDQQWVAVMSFKGDAAGSTQTNRLDDPTVCLLNAAFTLGGSQFPQRMFSSGMNNAAQMLSGFGWMR